uniref:Uncharacterized protein C16orf95 homolog n=1 Tax=Castor canadensis TaxID=51338 RepID=A0A8B7VU10_CASCN|nr:uncharacterized protein C16orf95 homolog [Castor canadensis]
MHPGAQTVFRERICCACHAKFGGHLPVPLAEAALPYWVPLSLRPQKQIPKMARFNVPKATKICLCLCHSFGGCLPMPRGQAVMPYWVPRALRSWKKVRRRLTGQRGLSGGCKVKGHKGAWPPPYRTQNTCHEARHHSGNNKSSGFVLLIWHGPHITRSLQSLPQAGVFPCPHTPSCPLERPLESCSWHRRWRICGDRRLLLKWQHLQALHQDKPLALGRAVHPRAPLLPFSLLILLQAILRAIMAIRQFFGV